MHPYERWTIRRYLANALRSSRFARAPRADTDIVTWIESHARSLDLPKLSPRAHASRRWETIDSPIDAARWKAWRAAAIGLAGQPPPKPSPLQERLDWLARACSLTDGQSGVLGLLARATQASPVCALVEAVSDRFGLSLEGAHGFDLHPFLETSSERGELSAGGRLSELGLIETREGPRLSVVVCRLLSLPRFGPRRVSELVLGEAAPASLAWSDFEHLGDLRDLAARIVTAAGNARGRTRRGVSLLIYGPPGTGKREFAKTLGAHVGFSVRFTGETNDENAEPSRRERIATLMIANAIGAVSRETIIVVDEADDLFIGFDEDDASDRRGSKVLVNRLLERVVAPTIWIANDVDRLGPAVTRRMNLVVRFPKPPLSVRRRIVSRIAKSIRFPLDEASALKLASASASPALIENAIRSAARIGGSTCEAVTILESSFHALGWRKTHRAPSPMEFDPALSSADVDLVKLADQVAGAQARALSFCLSGPPGTGKSAYARHLANRLNLDVLEKRFSDLSSMWLGESEKAIAGAFEEAADLRKFLILDEADSLLRDRAAAQHSWEITQVNEMLTQMERHPYPFACTTNAPELWMRRRRGGFCSRFAFCR